VDHSAGPKPAIWILCERFHPDTAATAHYLWGTAKALSASHPVIAVSSGEGRSETRIEGIRILRTGKSAHRWGGVLTRAAAGTLTALRMVQRCRRELREGDLVMLGTNPPVLPVLASLLLPKHTKLVYLLHDLYPEVLVAAGIIRPGGLGHRVLLRLARMPLRRADAIVPCGRDMAELVATKLPQEDHGRIRTITNWADQNEVTPRPRSESVILRDLRLDDLFVILYAGTIGRMQPISTLVEAAEELSEHQPEAHFLFLGSGGRERWLRQQIEARALTNITVLEPRPREEQTAFLAACDLAYIGLVPGMLGLGVPSRLYNTMAAGRPVVAQVHAQSEVGRTVVEEGIGWTVRPGDSRELTAAIGHAMGSPDELKRMGQRAREVAESRFSKEQALFAYRELVLGIMGRSA
jgi:colanic acid biosynthesis glycosyl transferase WcaI